MTQITDAKGNITQYVYDANGYLISSTNPLNQTTHYEYDAEGRVLKVIDAAQQTTIFERDAAGRVVKVTDSLGRSQALKLDAVGNVLAKVDGFNQTVAKFDYDALYNIETIHDGLGRSAQFAYDVGNRLTQAIDGLQRVTQFDYDVLDRLQTSVDALGGESQQDFDAEGLLSSFADTNQNQTRFTYDATGQVETMQTASGGEIRYGYDARDLLVSVTNGRGQVRDLTYDVIGRLTGWTDAEGQVQVTYDDNDNVLTVSDAQGTIRRSYDALDRIVSYTDVFGNQIGYEYDVLGQLVTVVYPDGKTVRYGYDAAGQLVSVTDWANRQTVYAYDANGRLVKTVRPNGSQQLRAYDVIGQLLSMQDVDSSGQVIVRYDFRYDLAGNIVEERVTPTPALMDLSPVAMDYVAGNQLAHFNTAAMQFDADNNMLHGVLNGELVDFAYDSRNRLTAVGVMAYRYDAENHRVGVAVNGDETRYVVNALPALSQVLVREQADGSQTFYVYGLGLIGEESAAGYLSYHFDLRGSTVALSGIDGSVVKRFQYSPYGGLVSDSPALVDTPFLYNGRDGVMTDDTGLYYMRARYYNPEIRRFVNQDPLLGFVADGQSLNRYAYVTGEPVRFIDPFGLKKVLEIDTIIGQAECAYGIGMECNVEAGYGNRNPDHPLFIDGYITNSQRLGIITTEDDNFDILSAGANWTPLGAKGKIESNFMGIHLATWVNPGAGVGGGGKLGFAKLRENKFGGSAEVDVKLAVGTSLGVSLYVDGGEFIDSCKEIGEAISILGTAASNGISENIEAVKTEFNRANNQLNDMERYFRTSPVEANDYFINLFSP